MIGCVAEPQLVAISEPSAPMKSWTEVELRDGLAKDLRLIALRHQGDRLLWSLFGNDEEHGYSAWESLDGSDYVVFGFHLCPGGLNRIF